MARRPKLERMTDAELSAYRRDMAQTSGKCAGREYRKALDEQIRRERAALDNLEA